MTQNQFVINVDETNFNEVLQGSVQTPILLDFWADWCQPCKALAPVLEKLAAEYQGAFILAKIDTEANQMLAAQLGVRSIPALKLVMQGQLVDELNGAESEAVLRQFLERHLGPAPEVEEEPADDFAAQIQRARRLGAHDQALAALQAAIAEDPNELSYQVLQAEVLMDTDALPEARQVLEAVSDEAVKAAAQARLFLLEELAGFETEQSLEFRIANDAGDIEAKYFMGINCVMAGEFEAGMRLFLEVLSADRQFRDDAGRRALLETFKLVPDSALASAYRRQLFARLH